MKRNLLIAAAALALVAGCATAPKETTTVADVTPAPAPKPRPSIGDWGFDVTGMDAKTKAGDDFFRYGGGGWMDTYEIPADRTSWGAFAELDAKSEKDTRAIIDELAAKQNTDGTIEQKIGDYYNSYLDTAKIDSLGLAPAQPGLDAIAAAKTHEDIGRLIGRMDLPLNSPIAAGVTLDEKNPDRYIVGISHAGLSLPEREYYLKKDKEFADIRTAFLAHVEKMFTLAGQKDGAAKAKQILTLETDIAKLHWPIAKRRERELTYNIRTLAQLKKESPGFPWDAVFAEAGFGNEKEFVVAEADAIPGLAKLFKKTPVSTWKTYLTYQYLTNTASTLPKAFDDENFAFYGNILEGQPQQRERWKRGVDAIDGALGEAVGQVYVQRHFTADSKAKMKDLVENLRTAYKARIESINWMTPETKKVAYEKLATFNPKIGYPDKWRDYSALEVKSGDAFGNRIRSGVFEAKRDAARLGTKTDRNEWFMTPQTVNAYYNPVFNEVVFPAAILQAPFFDANADPAVNYGAIGGVIGHEMGHGFDDQGAKSDAQGVLRTWWSKTDEDAFKGLGDKLVAQYDTYEPIPGVKVNGRLTLGENIGDLGGLTVAHEAYKLSLDGKPAPTLYGYTGDQRFFLAWSQVWRSEYRDAALRNRIMSDPHSPPQYRVNGVVRNMDSWYEAFGVKEGDKLYLAPEQRVNIW